MTEGQYNDIQVGDTVFHAIAPHRLWIVVCPSALGGWVVMTEKGIRQITRLINYAEWEMHTRRNSLL